jgi:hypothetical protein
MSYLQGISCINISLRRLIFNIEMSYLQGINCINISLRRLIFNIESLTVDYRSIDLSTKDKKLTMKALHEL